MRDRKSWLLVLICLCSMCHTYGQNLMKLNGDTIYISEKAKTFLHFEYDVVFELLEGQEAYEIEADENDIKIALTPGNKKNGTSEIGSVMITEKDGKKKMRQYRFYLMYKKNGDFQKYYDLSSEEKIQEYSANRDRKKVEAKSAVVQPSKQVAANTGSDKTYGPEEYEEKDIDINQEELVKRISNLVYRFNNYREQLVAEKSKAKFFKEKIVRELFNNCDTCIITVVPGANKPPLPLRLTSYLGRLASLPKNISVEFQADKISVTGKPRYDDARGKWYVSVEVLQNYTKVLNTENLRKVYSDLTRQTAQVEIVVYQNMNENGKVERKWEVFFTDVTGKEVVTAGK